MQLSFNTQEAQFQRGWNDADRGVPQLSRDIDYVLGYEAHVEYAAFLEEQDAQAIEFTLPEHEHA